MSAESGFVEVKGGRIFFEKSGAGPGLVCVHAGIADHRMWNRELEEYARDHTVVTYDVRGFGRSTAATSEYSDMDDLLAVLDNADIPRPALIGCSAGGRIAIDFAIAHPERFDRLVLVAPGVGGLQLSGDPEEKAAFEEEDRRLEPIMAAYKAGHREAAVDGMRKFWCGAQAGPSLDLVTKMLRENLDEVFTDASSSHSKRLDPPAAGRLDSIRTPTLILIGDRDVPGMPFIVNRVASGIPGAVKKTIPGADHLINLSQPKEFDEALRAFLR